MRRAAAGSPRLTGGSGPAGMNAPRRWLRCVAGSALAIAVVCAAMVIALLVASRGAPSWYAPAAHADAPSARAAEQFEYGLVVECQSVRAPHETWHLVLPAPEVNQWLATRLDAWLVQQGIVADIDGLRAHPPQVHLDDGLLHVALRLPLERVAVLTVSLHLADGMLCVIAESAMVGLVPVPVSHVLSRALGASLSDGDGLHVGVRPDDGRLEARFPARFRLADGRQVSLLDLEVRAGAIEGTLRTAVEAPEDAGEAFPEEQVPPGGITE